MRRTQTITYACMVLVLIGFTAWLVELGHAEPSHRCAGAAIEQAHKLLAFHFGPDDRIEIAPSVKALPSVRNPANMTQRLDVLEVWGYIYKGQYRMRFLYAQLLSECLLMGQEILEYTGL